MDLYIYNTNGFKYVILIIENWTLKKGLHLLNLYEIVLEVWFSSRKWKQWACKPTFLGPHPSPFGRPVLKNKKLGEINSSENPALRFAQLKQVATVNCIIVGLGYKSSSEKAQWRYFLSVVHPTGSPHPNQECETSQEGEAPERISTLEDIWLVRLSSWLHSSSPRARQVRPTFSGLMK